MQVSNRFIRTTSIIISASVICICSAWGAPGVSSPTAPTVTPPTITTPTMPTITSPTISNDYYTPGNTSSASKQTPVTNAATQSNNKPSNATTSEPSTSKTNSPTSINDFLSSLSASDISSLGNMGLLSSITGNSNSLLSSLTNQTTSTTDTSTLTMLQQILTELEELKKQVNVTATPATTATATTTAATTTTASETTTAPSTTGTTSSSSTSTQKRNSYLLRFIVNGYDIRKTCRIVYISKIEKDGTFILTGDRRYQSDNATRTETFYLLFRAKGVENGQKIYSVAAAVTQDYLNEYSFLYQLAQRKDLTATQTGNLVILRTTDPSWKLDLLLDLEEQ